MCTHEAWCGFFHSPGLEGTVPALPTALPCARSHPATACKAPPCVPLALLCVALAVAAASWAFLPPTSTLLLWRNSWGTCHRGYTLGGRSCRRRRGGQQTMAACTRW